MRSRPIVSLLLASALPLTFSVEGLGADSPLFSVRFNQKSVTLAGKIDSAATADALADVVKGARPDLKTSTDGLVVDPSVEFPSLGDIKSLLAEIGLSTHEGLLELWHDRIVIGGLTDSAVTQTALRIRVEPLLAGKSLIDRVCIVGADELPRINLSNAEGTTKVLPSPAVSPPRVGPAFEVPGILLEKLFPALVMLNQMDRLEGASGTPGNPVRATPLDATNGQEMQESNPGSSDPANTGLMLKATPVQDYEFLPSLRFSRNASILQSNQAAILDELAKRLLSPERAGAPVFIEGVIPAGGSVALNDYLAERRSAEVVRLLQERGLDPKLLFTGVIHSNSTSDEGEVRLRVEILVPQESPDPAAPVGNTAPDSGAPSDSTSEQSGGEPVGPPPGFGPR